MKLLFSFFWVSFSLTAQAQLSISNLFTEGLINPIGVDNPIPQLSWTIKSAQRNVLQTAFELKVFDNTQSKTVWNTGKVNSSQSINVKYTGSPVKSGHRYNWQVRVWDNQGNVSPWSELAFWQTSLLEKADWKASWIEVDNNIGTNSPYFRKKFQAKKKIISATLYVTAHGIYEAFINGERVGDAYLTPGWTSYKKRLQYQAYDVTKLLKPGTNAVGAMLGNGWYKGTINWEPRENIYGDRLGLLCQLSIRYVDGSEEVVCTDNSWKTSTGSIVYAEIYNGETIDANKDKNGWTLPAYDDEKWSNVKVAAYGFDNLIATSNQPIKKHEVLTPKKIITTPKGETVIDFGQNMVGWEKITFKGKKGDTVRIYHAEVLDKQGNFYTANLRSAKATSTYILSGNEDVFEPHFTFYGFRYIKVEGLTDSIASGSINAVALYSDMPKSGTFSSSNKLVNQLQQNIEWGQRGNFLDIPTDCPQRNERLGWTGDAHAFFRTATFLRDGNTFFKKWMKDMAADQLSDGRVPWVIPFTLRQDQVASTGWADASTIIPWQHYRAYGDTQILVDQYPSMKAWVDYMKNNSVDFLWNTEKFHFGDWLFFRPDDDKDGKAAITDKYLIAQSFFAHSTQMLINAAKVLGKEDDARYYAELLINIKKAFLKEYVTPSGRLVSSTQTAYVLALSFEMLPEAFRAQAAQRLVENISKYGHLTTGFLGTPYICHVLSDFGYDDVAYKLLLRERYPSWLYPVKSGATTIWERWDGQKPDGNFQTAEMNSFNHYAYGAIGDWLYRKAAGLQESAPGFKEIIIKPHVGGGFSGMKASHTTPFGEASSSWAIKNDELFLDVTIPVNTSAIVYVPASSKNEIMEGLIPVADVKSIKTEEKQDKYVPIKIGSGNYSFKVQKNSWK